LLARGGRARLHVSAVVRYHGAEVRRPARTGRMIAVAALVRELARKEASWDADDIGGSRYEKHDV
jgi:hypothetical protein